MRFQCRFAAALRPFLSRVERSSRELEVHDNVVFNTFCMRQLDDVNKQKETWTHTHNILWITSLSYLNTPHHITSRRLVPRVVMGLNIFVYGYLELRLVVPFIKWPGLLF